MDRAVTDSIEPGLAAAILVVAIVSDAERVSRTSFIPDLPDPVAALSSQ